MQNFKTEPLFFLNKLKIVSDAASQYSAFNSSLSPVLHLQKHNQE